MRAVTVNPDLPGVAKVGVGQVAQPRPGRGQVLVEVRAVGLGAFEKRIAATDDPAAVRKLLGSRTVPLGLEFSGVVRSDGDHLRVGQRVMGGPHFTRGERCLAEYVAVGEENVALIPDDLDGAAAAALPVAAQTALRSLDAARVGAGDRVLVVGAGGGVGVNVVQLAAARGAEVTALASARALPLVCELGAAYAHDYRDTAPADLGVFDAIIDHSGHHTFAGVAAHLTPRGAFVLLEPNKDVPGLARALVSRRRMPLVYVPQPTRPQLERVLEHVRRGELRPVVDATFDLEHLDEAFTELAAGSRRGRVVLTL
ncbi:MAG: zinc-binding dehydrogenase [Mobilicoccus sp.]|nr:zinc-binding dehydrogenase [Mobilicoccus sp.]